MRLLLGIDLGTSSVRAVVAAPDGRVLACAQQEYAIQTPRPGWAEQDPDEWTRRAAAAVRGAVSACPGGADAIAAVSFSGQMHGTVLLDAEGRPVRPAVIWADQRSGEQCRRIEEMVGGRDALGRVTRNRVAAGFMAATLLWLKENEPDALARARHALLPKDYVRRRLTGRVASEPSDACSTLLFDTARREWADDVIDALGLPRDLFPPLCGSAEVAGEITADAARETGLKPGVPVVAGGGDQPVAALANAALDPGVLLSTIGTGGQLFTPAREPRYDPALRTHTFCHVAPDRWYLMGASLCAGLSLRWLRDQVLAGASADYAQLSEEAGRTSPGAEGLLFLPYLVGERTPHMDPLARGAFVGLTLRHGRGHLARAVMEGVAFALRGSLEIFRALGLAFDSVIVSGGGARSALWRQIQADVFGLPAYTVEAAEHAGLGAAMLAGRGIGVYRNLADAAARVVKTTLAAEPDPRRTAFYNERYALFAELYPALKDAMHELSRRSEDYSAGS